MNQSKHLKPLWSALIGIVSLSTLIVSCQEKEGEGKKTLSSINASDQHKGYILATTIHLGYWLR